MPEDFATTATTIKKRDGRTERFDRRKLVHTLQALSFGLNTRFLDPQSIASVLEEQLPENEIQSCDLQDLVAATVASFSARHPDYSTLAGRLYVTNIHKRTPKRFSTWAKEQLYLGIPVLDPIFLSVVAQHSDVIDAAILHSRDFDYTYLALRALEKSYLLTIQGESTERPQFMHMRVAISIRLHDIAGVLETYELLSTKKYCHASPTVWNAGTADQNSSSCFIFRPLSDPTLSTVESVTDMSSIWESDGGIGIDLARIAARGDAVHRTPGILPLLKIYDASAQYWSRQSRHRSSTAAAFLPIWHSEVRDFLLSRTNRAAQGFRFHNIYPALWVPDVYMERLRDGGSWSLFDPVDVHDLFNLTGEAFREAFEDFETRGIAKVQLPARRLWRMIADAARESGTPFIMFSDNINARNNQKHLGVLWSSNLCTEIVQYASEDETAVCTLASLSLPRFLRSDGTFDFDELHRVVKIVVVNLDHVLTHSDYPTLKSAESAFGSRSLGIGAQGLADVFAMLEYPFNSTEARNLNMQIYETIFHGALESSCELAKRLGRYRTWEGSPASEGILQVDMWSAQTSPRHDFDRLRADIAKFGLRNAMLTAQMPTASSSHLTGNSASIEPYTSNIVQHRLLSGTFNELSRHLVNALEKRGLWTERIRDDILAANGSVQQVANVPADLKAVFRTAFEIDQKDLIDMAADRAPFIDQSQSLTLFVAAPTPSILMELQLHAWSRKLKTGMYYLRSKASTDAQPIGVNIDSLGAASEGVASGSAPPACPCDA